MGHRQDQETKSRQFLQDAKMRRILLEFLWERYEEEREGAPPMPFPMMDDNQVRLHLKRILGIGGLW